MIISFKEDKSVFKPAKIVRLKNKKQFNHECVAFTFSKFLFSENE